MLRVGIIGAAGRMGKNIARIIYEDKDCEIVGAVDSSSSPAINLKINEVAGLGLGGVTISADILSSCKDCDVLVDFTGAKITMGNMQYYSQLKKPLVIGSTGFTDDDKLAIKKYAESFPIMLSSNMGLGVNVALKLIELAARALQGYDIEISEIHHNLKKDAPSGTAIMMAEAAAKGAEISLKDNAVYERHGLIGERKKNEIGIQSLRGGDVVGDHTVYFFGNNERIEITHRAHDRATFANGAVKAIKWIADKKPSLYNMNDVLGLK